MNLDIIIVTYNSKKWMRECIDSIEGQEKIELKSLKLYIVDNGSKDGTIEYIEQRRKDTKLGEINLLSTGKNLGFGLANNYGFEKANSEFVFFLNPDTKLDKNALYKMKQTIEQSTQDFAMWEFRQKPYEHPKYYNPLNGETSWASGACFIIKRDVFEKIGGFDKKIFMYAEDVDLSWKVRLEGYKIKYVPDATLTHYCYKEAGEIKPIQYYNSIINNLNLRLKYGNFKDFLRWVKYTVGILLRPQEFKGAKGGLIKTGLKNISNMPYYISWRYKDDRKKKLKTFKPTDRKSVV